MVGTSNEGTWNGPWFWGYHRICPFNGQDYHQLAWIPSHNLPSSLQNTYSLLVWFFWDDKDTIDYRGFSPIFNQYTLDIWSQNLTEPRENPGEPQFSGFYSCTRTAWWKSKTAIPGRRPICSQHLGQGGHKKWVFRWWMVDFIPINCIVSTKNQLWNTILLVRAP